MNLQQGKGPENEKSYQASLIAKREQDLQAYRDRMKIDPGGSRFVMQIKFKKPLTNGRQTQIYFSPFEHSDPFTKQLVRNDSLSLHVFQKTLHQHQQNKLIITGGIWTNDTANVQLVKCVGSYQYFILPGISFLKNEKGETILNLKPKP